MDKSNATKEGVSELKNLIKGLSESIDAKFIKIDADLDELKDDIETIAEEVKKINIKNEGKYDGKSYSG